MWIVKVHGSNKHDMLQGNPMYNQVWNLNKDLFLSDEIRSNLLQTIVYMWL